MLERKEVWTLLASLDVSGLGAFVIESVWDNLAHTVNVIVYTS